MQQSQYSYTNSPPEITEFAEIRELIGWQNPASVELALSISSSLFWLCIYDDKKLIATGRVIGDGAMYFYIQDVIVHPDYQGKGLGEEVMVAVNKYLSETCQSGATIGLLAAKGKEGFYKKFEFIERTGTNLGLGMCKFV